MPAKTSQCLGSADPELAVALAPADYGLHYGVLGSLLVPPGEISKSVRVEAQDSRHAGVGLSGRLGAPCLYEVLERHPAATY